MNDLDLLRTYEPAIHYTLGEMFFPCAVDGYLQNTSLWLADSERQTTCCGRTGATDHDRRWPSFALHRSATATTFSLWTSRCRP